MSTVSPERPLLQQSLAILAGLLLGAGGLFFGFALATLTVVLVIVTTGSSVSNLAFVVINLTFIQGVGCIGVALAYYKFRPAIAPRVRSVLDLDGAGRPLVIPASIPDGRDILTIVVGYGGAFTVAIAGSVLLAVAQSVGGSSIETGTNQAAEIGQQSPEVLLLLIPASILLIGPGEELLFRGVVQGRIREMFSPVPGILIPSALFGGLHWFALSGGSLTGNLFVLGLLTAVGTVLGVTYEVTDNIVVPSAIHGFYNATLFSLLYVAIAYGDEFSEGTAVLGL